jgi:hypothetical protein
MIARLAILLVLAHASASAQNPAANGGWLDKPLTNWNKPGATVPKAPPPDLSADQRARCAKEFTRPPSTAEDRAVADAGWTLIGPLQVYAGTSVLLASADYDGMCRPTPIQGFVFSGGTFAGTLSPSLVYARSDGALTAVNLRSATELSAQFVRYTAKDPLCCPSRISTVQFEIRAGLVVPLSAESNKP